MSEEEILKELRFYIRKWHKGGFISQGIKKRLDSLMFYKDWEIAGKANQDTRQRLYLIKTHGKCANCGSTKNLTQDHIHPSSKGGKNGLHNKQLLCQSCNKKKADKIL